MDYYYQLKRQDDAKKTQAVNKAFHSLWTSCISDPIIYKLIVSFLTFRDIVSLSHSSIDWYVNLDDSLAWYPEIYRLQHQVSNMNHNIRVFLDYTMDNPIHYSPGYLDDRDFQSIENLKNPSDLVKQLIRVLLCLIFETKYASLKSWDACRKLLRSQKKRDNWRLRLSNFDADAIPAYFRRVLLKMAPKLDPSIIRRYSVSAENLAIWIQKLASYIHSKTEARFYDIEKFQSTKLKACRSLVFIQQRLELTSLPTLYDPDASPSGLVADDHPTAPSSSSDLIHFPRPVDHNDDDSLSSTSDSSSAPSFSMSLATSTAQSIFHEDTLTSPKPSEPC